MTGPLGLGRSFAVAGGLLCLTALAWGQFSGVRSKVELVGPKRPSRPPDCEAALFNESKPERPFEVVARIDVYVRRNKVTKGKQAIYEEALPELKLQTCKEGGLMPSLSCARRSRIPANSNSSMLRRKPSITPTTMANRELCRGD